jgi:integrase
MASSQTLTRQSDVVGLLLPSGKDEIVYFDQSKTNGAHGLGLRIREGGSRKWVFFYRWGGKQRKYTIGDSSNDPNGWTLARARGKAAELRVMVNSGKDPAAEKERIERQASNSKSFKQAVDAYLAARRPHMKPRSHAESTRHLEGHWKTFHGRAVHEIDADMVADRLKEIEAESGAVARNRARSSLSAMFAWTIGERFSKQLRTNPVDGTVKAEESGPRERVLTDAELVKIWKAAPDNNYGRIVKLLMLTGQRREEIGALGWSEINEDKQQIELQQSRTKNRRPHDVPLSDRASAVLNSIRRIPNRNSVFGEGEGGYSGWSRSKKELDAKAKVTGWTLQDLRRTAATGMVDLGVQPHVIEAVLNHVSGHKAGVAGIYNRSTCAAEKRAALQLWASHIEAITATKPGVLAVRAVSAERHQAEERRASFAERLSKART